MQSNLNGILMLPGHECNTMVIGSHEIEPSLSCVASMHQNGYGIVGNRSSQEGSPMTQKISVLGIDIAKLVFHILGMDDTGHVVLRRRAARNEVYRCSAHFSSSASFCIASVRMLRNQVGSSCG